MNKTHRSLWNPALGAWVAAPENTPARGKRACSAVLAAAVVAVFASFANPAEAQSTWSNAGTGSWFDAGNWTGGVPSEATFQTTVNNGGTSQIAGAASVGNAGVLIGGSSTVELRSGGSLTATGDFGGVTVNPTGTLLLSGSTDVFGSVLLDGGTLRSTTTGSLTSNILVNSTGTISAAAGQTLTLAPSFLGADGTSIRFGSATDTGVVVLGPVDLGLSTGPALAVEVAGGTLRAGDPTLNLLTRVSADVTVDAGATLDLNDFSTGIGTRGASAGTLRGAGSIATGTNAATTLSLVNADFSGSISGAGQVSLELGGTVLLSGTNTYTGATTIDTGSTLRAGARNAFAPLSATSVASGATLDLNNFDQTIGSLAGSGNVTLGAATLTTGNDNASTTFSGLISGSGGLAKVGMGTFTLSGTGNTYTGATNVNAGTLQAGAANTFAPASAFTIASNATLDLGGFSQAIGSLAGQGSVNLGTATLSTGNDNTNTAYAGAISGAGGSLTKTGTGTLTLTAANSYTGGTALKAGRLAVGSDTALGTGALAMDPGTTLGFAADGLTLANRIAFTAAADPTLDTGAFTATLAGAITGPGDLTKTGSGTLVLRGPNTYSGATNVAEGTLRAGAVNTFSAASAHTLAAGATLDLAGFNQTLAGLTNAGTVSLIGTAPGTTLTVTGPYVGNNGVLKLGTALGDSRSVSDKLVLNGGRASGSTTVQIVNLGGLGAQTTGNGIEVIGTANGGSIDAGAFTLASGHVDAGAYEYRLNTIASGGYLSSSTTAPPAPSVLPAISLPMYRSEVPLLAALPEQQRQADLTMLGNLHQRIGDDDVKSASAGSSTIDSGGNGRRAWGRLLSSDLNIRQAGTVSPTSNGRLTGFQAGADLLVIPHWRAGVYVGQLDGDMAVNGFARGVYQLRVGGNDLRNRYLGMYGTYTDDSGFYADAVVQAGRHRFTIEPVTAFGIDGRGSSVLASIEAGQSFHLGGTGNWQIEPQLQLAHQSQRLDDLTIGGATLVQRHPDNGWLARLGVRIKGEMSTRAGSLQPYARLNTYRTSSGSDLIDFIGPAGATAVQTRIGSISTELAAGATLALAKDVSLFGELGKLWASGGAARIKSTLQGSLGMRMCW